MVRFRFSQFESNLSEHPSNKEVNTLVDVYVDAIENYERDIMDAVMFYMAKYGNTDTKQYIQMIIEQRRDSFVTSHLKPLLNVITKSREGK
ncbi:hypothetical protein [Escherichia coli]|uniref:hypothetical protein n=1 Tax=Escherichia coli TaxID=562 RepID=UPI00148EDAF2|nr:hypothetical protein [Escherichia coli]QJU23685.1 hypothetical protein HLY11_03265 [Escherichia coli]